ncbi:MULTISPECIES: DUF2147 domain-containing protein [Novosphingobium]|uniref:DUF2147 domain-containing protein n=1 Tax=Novosphingobium TaxID=165696 RepID=UPI001CD58F8A|nr:DUF2147 domain-containing protein [Novosphingobium percolationis]MCH7629016.1 DUF2147 domain-containing protein [Pseudomonadota bacterium]
MPRLRKLLLTLLTIFATPALAHARFAGGAGDPLCGAWRNDDNSVAVRIDACGGKLCGTVTAANATAIADARGGGTDRLIGTPLLEDYRRDGPNHWSGTVFVPDLGHRFSSHITLIDRDHARIAGCLLGRFVCQSEVWQRQ